MEKDFEVKTKLVKYLCDDCGGEVQCLENGMILPKNNKSNEQPKFRHVCTSCGKKYVFDFKYPYTKYEYI